MNAPRARSPRTAGFTLVEILVVMLIISGILVTITQLLNGARTTRDQIHNIQETLLAGPAILDRIERDLRAIFPLAQERKGHLIVQDRVRGGQDGDTLSFVCANTAAMVTEEPSRRLFLRPDYTSVSYVLRPNPMLDDFLELYRREDFGIATDDSREPGRYSLLNDRIRGFDIEVFAEDGPDVDPLDSWGDGDPEQIGLPARIEISLQLELSPRLVQEQSAIALTDRRLLTYKRVIRFPEHLRHATTVQPVPLIPVIEPPTDGPIGGPGGDENLVPGQPGVPPGGGTPPPIDIGDALGGQGGGSGGGGIAIPIPGGG